MTNEDYLAINLSAIGLIYLSIYAVKKWALKGDIFHPGLIYSLVNSFFFIIFAFGPYDYKAKIYESYYYMYFAITVSFVAGIAWACRQKSKFFLKDIKVKKKHLFWLSLLVGIPLILSLISLGLSTNFNLTDAANKRLEDASLRMEQTQANLLEVFISFLGLSYVQLLTSILVAASFQYKKFTYLLGLAFIEIGLALLQNSRTFLIFSILLLLVPIYIVKKSSYTSFTWKKLIKLLQKQYKLIPIVFFTITLMIVLTNVRGDVRVSDSNSNQSSYEVLEELYQAKQKPWFAEISDSLPPSLINTITELSMYAGGTVVSGGITSRIVLDEGLYTWGFRNLFVFHRVLGQLGIDGGFSNESRDNYYAILKKAVGEIPAILTGWLGEPGNWIVDFGYLGAIVVSLVVGYLLGWMYNRLSQAGPIIYSAASSVFVLSMLLSPSVSFFGAFFSNSISFVFFLYYIFKKSYKNKVIYYQDRFL